MTAQPVALLPCPFCGGEPEPLWSGAVCCPDCGAHMDTAEGWNRRAPDLCAALEAAQRERDALAEVVRIALTTSHLNKDGFMVLTTAAEDYLRAALPTPPVSEEKPNE